MVSQNKLRACYDWVLSLSTCIITCKIVSENLWKQLMTSHIYLVFIAKHWALTTRTIIYIHWTTQKVWRYEIQIQLWWLLFLKFKYNVKIQFCISILERYVCLVWSNVCISGSLGGILTRIANNRRYKLNYNLILNHDVLFRNLETISEKIDYPHCCLGLGFLHMFNRLRNDV